jgi:hypothetical protein
MDVWNLPGLESEMRDERQRHAQLEAEMVAAHERTTTRQRVAAALAEGRMSLLQATAVFRELDEATPGYSLEYLRERYPGKTDDERHCRKVILYTTLALGDRPEGARGVGRRLEAELQAHLERGTLKVPRRSDAVRTN